MNWLRIHQWVKVKEDSSLMETGAHDEKKEPAWEKKYRIIS